MLVLTIGLFTIAVLGLAALVAAEIVDFFTGE